MIIKNHVQIQSGVYWMWSKYFKGQAHSWVEILDPGVFWIPRQEKQKLDELQVAQVMGQSKKYIKI